MNSFSDVIFTPLSNVNHIAAYAFKKKIGQASKPKPRQANGKYCILKCGILTNEMMLTNGHQ